MYIKELTIIGDTDGVEHVRNNINWNWEDCAGAVVLCSDTAQSL